MGFWVVRDGVRHSEALVLDARTGNGAHRVVPHAEVLRCAGGGRVGLRHSESLVLDVGGRDGALRMVPRGGIVARWLVVGNWQTHSETLVLDGQGSNGPHRAGSHAGINGEVEAGSRAGLKHFKPLVLDGRGRDGARRVVVHGEIWRQGWTVRPLGSSWWASIGFLDITGRSIPRRWSLTPKTATTHIGGWLGVASGISAGHPGQPGHCVGVDCVFGWCGQWKLAGSPGPDRSEPSPETATSRTGPDPSRGGPWEITSGLAACSSICSEVRAMVTVEGRTFLA